MISLMELRMHLALLLVLLGGSAPLIASDAHCPAKKVDFRITRKMLVRQKRAEAEGHQPWRSDAKFVASVGVMQADPSIHPAEERQFTSRVIERSVTKAVFLFRSPDSKKSYRVTVRRYHIRMPRSEKAITTVWWTTQVIITDCSTHVGSRNATSR